MNINPDFDIRPLAAAVIGNARGEAQHGDPSAFIWLQTDGLVWADAIGLEIDRETVRNAVKGKRKQKPFTAAQYSASRSTGRRDRMHGKSQHKHA
ncbi:MAG: hypothetical protein ABI904_00895 [Chloroflexota bacterium]